MKLCHIYTTMLNGESSLVSLLPERLQCNFPTMQNILISTAGVKKLLSDLNVSKAAGPDVIRPGNCFKAIEPGNLTCRTVVQFLLGGRRPKFAPSSEKETRQTLQITGPFR